MNGDNHNRPPPPIHSRFAPGKSGNPNGRPKGARSPRKTTEKLAYERVTTRDADGKQVKMATVDAIIVAFQILAAKGQLRAVRKLDAILEEGGGPVETAGVLVVHKPVERGAFLAAEEARNVGKREPGTYIDVIARAHDRRRRGVSTPLVEAIAAFARKWQL